VVELPIVTPTRIYICESLSAGVRYLRFRYLIQGCLETCCSSNPIRCACGFHLSSFRRSLSFYRAFLTRICRNRTLKSVVRGCNLYSPLASTANKMGAPLGLLQLQVSEHIYLEYSCILSTDIPKRSQQLKSAS